MIINQKIIIIVLVLVIVSLSVINVTNEIPSNEPFNIQNQDDMTEVIISLTEEMIESRIFLSSWDIYQLVSYDPDVSLITFDPNNMDGFSGGGGTSSHGYTLTKNLLNGTRTFEEYSLKDTLLKSIIIHDVPEKRITMIFK